MLRRAPTTLKLKLDDIQEYEEMRHQMALNKSLNQRGYNNLPSVTTEAKSKEEIHKRLGYVPDKPSQVRDNIFN